MGGVFGKSATTDNRKATLGGNLTAILNLAIGIEGVGTQRYESRSRIDNGIINTDQTIDSELGTGGNLAIGGNEQSAGGDFNIAPRSFKSIGIDAAIFEEGDGVGIEGDVAAVTEAKGFSVDRTAVAQL